MQALRSGQEGDIVLAFMKFVLFMLVLLGATLQAQPELPTGPVPPNARPVEVSTVRGGTVEITLETDRRTPRQLRFVTRQPPAHGKLSELRVTDAHSATVTYTHGGDSDSATDQFRFAAGAPGFGYSAPATVTIRITNPPARLKATPELNLGEILQGNPANGKLILQNAGGESVEGIISVPAPWQLIPSDAYKIKPGESAEFEVHLVNAAAGNFDGTARYSSHPLVRTSLRAQVIEPFVLKPPALEKSHWIGNQTAEISITNFTSLDQEFKITSPDGIKSPPALIIPAKSSATLTVAITDPIRARSGTSIILSSRLRKLAIPMAVPDQPPAPPKPKISQPPPLLPAREEAIRPSPKLQAAPAAPDIRPTSTPALPPPNDEIEQEVPDLALFQELGLAPQPNPVAAELQIIKLKPTSVTLMWKAKPPLQAADYQVESLTLASDENGKLSPRWERIPPNPRSGSSGTVSVTINQLLPESVYHFRITSDRFTPEDEDPPSPAFAPPILTPAKGLFGPILIGICLAGTAMIAGILWKLRQNTVDK